MPMIERATVTRWMGSVVVSLAVGQMAVADVQGGNPWSLSPAPPPPSPAFTVDGGHTGAFPPQGYRPSRGSDSRPRGASDWPMPSHPNPHAPYPWATWGQDHWVPHDHAPYGGWPYTGQPPIGAPPYSGALPWAPSHRHFPFVGFPFPY